MTSIKCAAFCCLNSECGHFHFSNVNNLCYIFKEEVWFTPSRDLTADPNWTTGTLLNGKSRNLHLKYLMGWLSEFDSFNYMDNTLKHAKSVIRLGYELRNKKLYVGQK